MCPKGILEIHTGVYPVPGHDPSFGGGGGGEGRMSRRDPVLKKNKKEVLSVFS